jgi:hypothetical protein
MIGCGHVQVESGRRAEGPYIGQTGNQVLSMKLFRQLAGEANKCNVYLYTLRASI